MASSRSNQLTLLTPLFFPLLRVTAPLRASRRNARTPVAKEWKPRSNHSHKNELFLFVQGRYKHKQINQCVDLTSPLGGRACLALLWRRACFVAAAIGHPLRLRCVLRLVLTWPRPLHPGVGHFRMVSCIAKTTAGKEPALVNSNTPSVCQKEYPRQCIGQTGSG